MGSWELEGGWGLKFLSKMGKVRIKCQLMVCESEQRKQPSAVSVTVQRRAIFPEEAGP